MRQTGNFGQSYPSEVNTIIRVLVLLQKFHHQYYNMRFQTVIVRLVELSLNSSAFIWISERSEKFEKLLTDQRWDTRVRPWLMKGKIIFHYIIQGHNVLNINEDILKNWRQHPPGQSWVRQCVSVSWLLVQTRVPSTPVTRGPGRSPSQEHSTLVENKSVCCIQTNIHFV